MTFSIDNKFDEPTKKHAVHSIFKSILLAVFFFSSLISSGVSFASDNSEPEWEALRSIAVNMAETGDSIAKTGDSLQAFSNYSEALRRFLLLSENYPDKVKSKTDLSALYDRLGDFYVKLGRKTDALSCYLKSQKVGEESVNGDKLENKVLGYLKLGDIYSWLDMPDEAVSSYKRAVKVLDKKVSDDKIQTRYQYLSFLNHRIWRVYSLLKNNEKAAQAGKRDLEIRNKIIDSDDGNGTAVFGLGNSFKNIGERYAYEGMAADAEDALLQAEDIYSRLLKMVPENYDYMWAQMELYSSLGDLYLSVGQYENAIKAGINGLGLSEKIAANKDNDTNEQVNLSVSLYRLGSIYRLAGDDQKSIEYYLKSLDIRRQALAAEPDREKYRTAVTDCLKSLADLYAQTEEADKSVSAYKEILNIMNPVFEKTPTSDDQRFIMVTYYKLSRVYYGSGRHNLAEQSYNKALDIAGQRVKRFPTDGQCRVDFYQIKSSDYSD